jgi:hypothetical protein
MTASGFFRFVILSAPFALMACTSTDLAMPTGYTYHNEVYKSQPGPEAAMPAKILKAGDTAPNGMTVMQTESVGLNGTMDANGNYPDSVLCAAADDLVGRLLTNFGRPMERTLVPDTSPLTACLKAALSRGNVPVATNPGDGPFVLDHSISNGSASITFMSNHDPVVSESGSYAGTAPAMDMAPTTAEPVVLR